MKSLNSINSENAVISSCLNNLDKGIHGHVSRIAGNNAETIFSDPRNSAIFSVIGNITDKGGFPTVSIIIDTLDNQYDALFDEGAEDYINSVLLTPALYNIDQLTYTVEQLMTLRTLRRQLTEIETVAQDMKDPDVEAEPGDVAKRLQDIITDTEVASEVETFAEIVDDILNSTRAMWTQTTGIKELDYVFGGRGFESGTLCVIGARPKVGKTIFMNSMVYQTLQEGNHPVVLNYETKRIEFVSKILSRHLAIDGLSWGIIKSYLSKEESEYGYKKEHVQAIKRGLEWSQEQNWEVAFDKTMSMQDIEALVVKAKAEQEEGAKVILFVDYLQLQITDSLREREQIGDLTRFYKRLAGTYDIAVVILSQLNRSASDGKPSAHQLRGAGNIEQDSDVIILLDKPARPERAETDDVHLLEVNALTSRLSEGGEFNLFIDGANQIIDELQDWQLDTEEDEYTQPVAGFEM